RMFEVGRGAEKSVESSRSRMPGGAVARLRRVQLDERSKKEPGYPDLRIPRLVPSPHTVTLRRLLRDLDGVAVDELVEVARVAARRLLLVHEGKIVLIELLEELVPGDLF